jgi:hypothetical protein
LRRRAKKAEVEKNRGREENAENTKRKEDGPLGR